MKINNQKININGKAHIAYHVSFKRLVCLFFVFGVLSMYVPGYTYTANK